MSAQWYYTKNGQKTGPITDQQLKQLADSGEINPTDTLWKEGMVEGRPASQISGLFQTPLNFSFSDENVSVKKTIVSGLKYISGKLQNATFESPDESQIENGPAIFLNSHYFGGRTTIGYNLAALRTLSSRIVTAFFSWAYLLPVIFNTASSWQFLPFNKTEFAKIILKQNIKYYKVLPFIVFWAFLQIINLSVSMILVFCLKGSLLVFVPVAIFIISIFLINLIAGESVSRMDSKTLYRSVVVFEYGFPEKHILTYGVSDAPIEQQMAGVLSLCEAISKSEFGKWDQITTHGPSRLFSALPSFIPIKGIVISVLGLFGIVFVFMVLFWFVSMMSSFFTSPESLDYSTKNNYGDFFEWGGATGPAPAKNKAFRKAGW